MKQIILVLVSAATLFSSCEKGIIFDSNMLIGTWKSMEYYDNPHQWLWVIDANNISIYRDCITEDSLIHSQDNWNTGTYDINLFEDSNPVDSVGEFQAYIYIAKYDRDYVVLKSEKTNYSFSLSRLK